MWDTPPRCALAVRLAGSRTPSRWHVRRQLAGPGVSSCGAVLPFRGRFSPRFAERESLGFLAAPTSLLAREAGTETESSIPWTMCPCPTAKVRRRRVEAVGTGLPVFAAAARGELCKSQLADPRPPLRSVAIRRQGARRLRLAESVAPSPVPPPFDRFTGGKRSTMRPQAASMGSRPMPGLPGDDRELDWSGCTALSRDRAARPGSKAMSGLPAIAADPSGECWFLRMTSSIQSDDERAARGSRPTPSGAAFDPTGHPDFLLGGSARAPSE
jgi:hypothetical protein